LQIRKSAFIKPPYLKFDFIREKAEDFRKNYIDPVGLVPVPITEIVEFGLKLKVITIPGMLAAIDIDGFLTNDLKAICIDTDMYMNRRCENRQRFTFAHEIGHLILHAAEIKKCRFRTPEAWKHFHEDFNKEDLDWFEQQAREFGGRLLVPISDLESKIRAYLPEIKEYHKKTGPDKAELIKDAISRLICTAFQVSPDVILIRIERERLNTLFA
jgi:Zn-dependent peptidase ImmA (M78 family)